MFQFHKGTIRTSGTRELYAGFTCFNSIKVRLEHCAVLASSLSFEFQFHKGTIRTTKAAPVAFAVVSGFNSIKVRLEPRERK